jgi:hypothetical protein
MNSRKNKRKIWDMVERILFMFQKTQEGELIILKEKSEYRRHYCDF